MSAASLSVVPCSHSTAAHISFTRLQTRADRATASGGRTTASVSESIRSPETQVLESEKRMNVETDVMKTRLTLMESVYWAAKSLGETAA